MNAVKMPRLVVAVTVLMLFALSLYAMWSYGSMGQTSHLALAVGSAGACLVIVAGLIYANYERYAADADRNHHHLNGTP